MAKSTYLIRAPPQHHPKTAADDVVVNIPITKKDIEIRDENVCE